MDAFAVDGIDTAELQERGFTRVRNLVSAEDLARFEADIQRFVDVQAPECGLPTDGTDPFLALFTQSQEYRLRVYPLFERLAVFQEMTTKIYARLQAAGFLRWSGFEVPLLWPEARADPPADRLLSLPMHQDFAATQCAKAWRLWIALRRSDAHHGSMEVVPGSHKRGCLPHNLDDPLFPYVEAGEFGGGTPEVLEVDAGDGVIIDPFLVHASVKNRSDRMKFTLMVQVQDMASVIDPARGDDPLALFREIYRVRAEARKAAGVG